MIRWLAAAAALATSACPGGGAMRPHPAEDLPLAVKEPAAGAYGPEPAASAAPVEARAVMAARARLARSGAPPRTSTALIVAARELARRAAAGDPQALSQARVRGALARALAYDAAPSVAFAAAPDANVVASILPLVSQGGATHVGAGAFERDGTVYLVVLSSVRRIALAPFPREVALRATATLSAELGPGLLHPRVFVTQPTGEVREVDATGGQAFRATIAFPVKGRYTIEVVAVGAKGPEVAALLTTSAGGASLDAEEVERPVPPDPADPAAAEARVVDAINETRRARGRALLQADGALAGIARSHSADMLARGELAHVLPGSGDLGDRLRRARVVYRKAFENVARGSSALGAHLVAEQSPAHLENVLAPDASRVGVGIARGKLSGGDPVVYLTEVFVEPSGEPDGPLTPDGRVREALWRERERQRQPPLLSDSKLDDLAREAALAMRDRGEPDAGGLGARALALGRKLSAVDTFVASVPDEAARSANLRDRRFRRVGVGISKGDSVRFGAGRLFIAIIYTD
jgi:uncharacterized protein YkwD